MNSHLPFSLSHSSILMIPVALGAVAGLFCFFHGFSLLQESRLALRRSIAATPLRSATITATTYSTKGADMLKRDSHAEVIKLSPGESSQNSSEFMTQQGKIAAALLKAGIPNPMTWADHAQTAVRVADPPANENATPAKTDAEVSRVLQQGANAPALRLPAHDQDRHNAADRKASLMIWGGPILTLACIYTLAAHFGWL